MANFIGSIKLLIPFSLFVAIGLFNVPSSRAQSQTGAKPSFEVVSIKIVEDCGNVRPGLRLKIKIPGGTTYQPGGRYTTCSQLRYIIHDAYQADLLTDISGVPGWSEDILYKIEAKADGNPDKDQMHLMVQSLLEERFKLKLHCETRETPVYSLVVAKGGPKLQQAKDEQGNPIVSLPPPDPDKKKAMDKLASGRLGPGSLGIMGKPSGLELTAKAVNMETLANTLFSMVGKRRVIDKTGLTGLYDFQMTFADPNSRQAPPGAAEPATAAESSAPSIFTAIQDQLGLKLVPDKAPLEFIVVDSVEKPPEN